MDTYLCLNHVALKDFGKHAVSAGIEQRHFRRFCSWGAAPVAGTRYALYMSF
jgi:hypothetical protein